MRILFVDGVMHGQMKEFDGQPPCVLNVPVPELVDFLMESEPSLVHFTYDRYELQQGETSMWFVLTRRVRS